MAAIMVVALLEDKGRRGGDDAYNEHPRWGFGYIF
jgi:hypothetical protein